MGTKCWLAVHHCLLQPHPALLGPPASASWGCPCPLSSRAQIWLPWCCRVETIRNEYIPNIEPSVPQASDWGLCPHWLGETRRCRVAVNGPDGRCTGWLLVPALLLKVPVVVIRTPLWCSPGPGSDQVSSGRAAVGATLCSGPWWISWRTFWESECVRAASAQAWRSSLGLIWGCKPGPECSGVHKGTCGVRATQVWIL